MASKSVIERMWEVNPEAEIWWDSSPVVFPNFRNQLIEKAPDKDEMTAWLDRLYSPGNAPLDNLFRGVTTNPPLSYNAIKDDPEYWAQWLDTFVAAAKCSDSKTMFWSAYREIVRRGADVYRPIFEDSNYKWGYISGQVDPRDKFDADVMLAQAMDLASIAPNVMIKVPGTAEGYQVIKKLTAKGVPTNNTLSFVIPQFVACMDAVTEGLAEAEANGVDLSQWRSVITHMTSRFGTLGDLKKEAEEKGIELSESDLRLAELAVFKKACRLVAENEKYPGKMLHCSLRLGPEENGVMQCWHLQMVAGADIVYTLPPSFIAELFLDAPHLEFQNRIDEPIDPKVMDKLMRLPYFEKGYAEDGYTVQEFNSHPALKTTAEQFTGATQEMVDFVAKRVSAYCQ